MLYLLFFVVLYSSINSRVQMKAGFHYKSFGCKNQSALECYRLQ